VRGLVRRRRAGGLGALVLLVAAATAAACAGRGFRAPSETDAAGVLPARAEPWPILGRVDRLARARERVRSGDAAMRPAYQLLRAQADSAMRLEPPTVMQKRAMPPSGDKHDFMSLAPYWWPDSTKPDGLPYVRRDGQMNPQSRLDHDGVRFQRMVDAVETLALAHYLSGDARYAAGAATFLRVWFVDPATRMNPHLRFAQAVLGVNEGRGIGIIDTRHLPQLVDALRLLERSGEWPAAERATVTTWLRDYLTWLRTSENGRDEADEANNHGTWYDAQVAAVALYVGDSAVARDVLDRSARERIASQIAADGRQQHELARTRPLHYSVFNLDAFTQLAEMGRHVGVDLWRDTASRGAGGTLVAALRFVAPYADAATPRPFTEVGTVGAEIFLVPLRRAADATGAPDFTAALRKLPAELTSTHRSRFLHPDVP
jgi:hypothetical protein